MKLVERQPLDAQGAEGALGGGPEVDRTPIAVPPPLEPYAAPPPVNSTEVVH